MSDFDLGPILAGMHTPTDAIAGYAEPLSAVAGEEIRVACATSARRYDVRVVRSGAVEEEVWSAAGLPGVAHPIPSDASVNGCGWPVAFTVPTRPQWRSGCYLVRFRASEPEGPGGENEAFFVLRSASPGRSRRLLVLSTSTWAAYNHWGGPSYYTGGTASSTLRPLPKGFLDRPEPERFRNAVLAPEGDPEMHGWTMYALGRGVSAWSACAGWPNWERPFVAFCERAGIELEYATSHDLEAVPGLLDPYRLYLSVGHDEYWSWGMRDAVEDFVRRGGNAAFFSGNTAYWQVRFEAGGRRVDCFKFRFEEDPLFGTPQQQRTTTMWSDPLIGRPENGLTGVSFTRGGYLREGYGVPRGSGGYTVWRPEHWIFDGTDLRYGDLLGARHVVAGYEADGCELALVDGLPVATGRDGTPPGFEVLASSPAHLWVQEDKPGGLRLLGGTGDLEWVCRRLLGADTAENRRRLAHGNAVLGSFTRGGTTFTTGCTDWACGLVGGDEAVERITRNVIDRLSR
jgi:hypothetical protein